MVSLGKRVFLCRGLPVVAAVAAIGTFARLSSATIAIDGVVDPGYGSAITSQTINTGFGDSTGNTDVYNDDGGTPGQPTTQGGSELDAAYGIVSGGNLNLMFTGDMEDNGNHLNIFIADGRPGQSTLNASVGPINQMNGSQFSPDFGNGATYVIDANDYQGTVYTDVDDLTGVTYSGYDGAFVTNNGLANTLSNNGLIESLNNGNVSTMGASGTAANQAAMLAATTGFEVAIPVNLLGNPGPGSFFDVFADINGGGNGYLSNQFLPGLPLGYGNLGNGGVFNFSGTPGEWFPVGVPEPGSLGMIAMGAIGLLIRRRRNA
ncbi:MAG TPA: PEP-CTERM sorting domain-containing protein [Phycisphaerae bacterium]|nr:PEP-CTERM sorting domain-containing protein [Phycisphaerae bacterium]